LHVLGLRGIAAQLGLVGAVGAASLNPEMVPEYTGAAKAVTLSTKHRRTVVREILPLARPQGQPRMSAGGGCGRSDAGGRLAPLARVLTIRVPGGGIRRLGRIGKTPSRKAETAFRDGVFVGSPSCFPFVGARNRLGRQTRCWLTLAGLRWPVVPW
jgi:hypothetical protein